MKWYTYEEMKTQWDGTMLHRVSIFPDMLDFLCMRLLSNPDYRDTHY